jgi:hypothetical protein
MTKKLEKRINALEARIRELEAFAGVLLPVFDKQYKKGGWNYSKK